MKKILITGGGGFCLSNFIRKAIHNKIDYQFVSIDACKGSNVLNNIYANKTHNFHICDIKDSNILSIIFESERPDIVIHAASEYSGSSDALISSNILGTNNVVEACRKYDIEKLIYISDAAIYGSYNGFRVDESYLKNPNSLYSITKLTAESIVRLFDRHQIIRLGQVYGPRQSLINNVVENTRTFIPSAIQSIKNNLKFEISIIKISDESIDWTHIDDICSAITLLLEKEVFGAFNIGSNYELSRAEVFQEICNFFKNGHDLLKFVETDFNNIYNNFDSSKIRSLGWKPSIKIKNGIAQTCDWYEKNSWALK